ncbi:hypothetical protein L249_2985 [Ophiocordyceps polyrhachis-furcata BCC 54312]|uniref:Amino acid permease/ SLC12A domain-containing protein n=1 Tax=Ophiocordyceps polyrhachis-furcata BCC 54312 TaxID=1330021 RepID=A0A367LRB9_9HYPO|nr:hypothetical protein L249_2985 [Ophiocordyceps polyrhachis-furcata BCC 54312]
MSNHVISHPLDPTKVDGSDFYDEANAPEDRKLGVVGVMFLIINSMIGTGGESDPQLLQNLLMLWLFGGIFSFCGLSVYLEYGLAIPRSGGEKNYLERVYRRPRYLATCILGAQVVLLSSQAENALSFGRYALLASGRESDGWEARGIAVSVVVFAAFTHSVFPKWGIRLFNVLGAVKVLSLLFVVFTGFAVLAGHRRVPDPRNFEKAFSVQVGQGYGGGGLYEYSTALLNVVFSYMGWSSANQVLGELKRPRKTLAVAAPLAVGIVTTLYLLVNIAYFSAITKSDLAKSEVLVAGVFFRNVFGGGGAAARALPLLVVLSNLGNVFAGIFAISRVMQELGKEDLLPFSRFWGSNRPFNTPAAALFWYATLTTAVLIAAPRGPAYTFIVSMSTYPTTWTQALITAGLIWLQLVKRENWTSRWRTPLPVSLTYLASNVFLMAVPFVPPRSRKGESYPYYVLPVVGVAAILVAVVYWALRMKLLPRLTGSKPLCERAFDEDGVDVVRHHVVALKR